MTICAYRQCDNAFGQPGQGPPKEYCSRRCGHRERRARAMDERPALLDCAVCGDPFKPVYPESGPASRCCSEECRREARNANKRELYKKRRANG